MNTLNLAANEQELQKYDFNQLNGFSQTAVADIANAKTAADVKTAICNVWNKIPDWAKKLLEAAPLVGKFFTLLATVLDSLCKG
jgi:hypothetical protein